MDGECICKGNVCRGSWAHPCERKNADHEHIVEE